MAKTQSLRKKLKPEIEKKRRDRINQNLSVLRILLFNSTANSRLQNPKLEKAEILDLAVQYIRKNARDKTNEKASVNQTVTEVTPEAHTYQHDSDFTSFVGQINHFESLNSRMSLEYHLDCQQGHSLREERESDTKSTSSHSKLDLSTSVSPSHAQNPIFVESPSIDLKSVYQKPNVFTQSELLSPPPSPHNLPLTSPVSHPFSSSPPLYTTAVSVCSPQNLPQRLHLNSPRDLPTSLSLNQDAREVRHPLETTWRPWR